MFCSKFFCSFGKKIGSCETNLELNSKAWFWDFIYSLWWHNHIYCIPTLECVLWAMISCLGRLKCRWLNHAAAKPSPTTTLSRNTKETAAAELGAPLPRRTPHAADKSTRELQVTRENPHSLETKVSSQVPISSHCVGTLHVTTVHGGIGSWNNTSPTDAATVYLN